MKLDRRFKAEQSVDSDAELMSEVSAGSVEAFSQLYDRFCNRAYRVAYSVCGDKGLAQDAVQEAFLTLWKSRTSYRPERGTVAAWLLTVVRYRAIDLARHNATQTAQSTSDDRLDKLQAPDDVHARVTERDAADRLRASLKGLPDDQREVIALAYFGELSHSEIAAQLCLPFGTVKGRMRLGLQKLRANMDKEGAGSTPIHTQANIAQSPVSDLNETVAA